jgi:hypothetical protein
MNDWICRFCGGIIRGRARMPVICPRCGLGTFKRVGGGPSSAPHGGPPSSGDGARTAAAQPGVRWPLELSVTCQGKDGKGTPLAGQTGNISRSGLLLTLSQELPPGTVLELTLHTASGPASVDGAVVWVEPPEKRKSSESVRHGVRFTSSTWALSLALRLLLAERRLT